MQNIFFFFENPETTSELQVSERLHEGIPYWKPQNIRPNRYKFSRPGGLASGLCAPSGNVKQLDFTSFGYQLSCALRHQTPVTWQHKNSHLYSQTSLPSIRVQETILLYRVDWLTCHDVSLCIVGPTYKTLYVICFVLIIYKLYMAD